jgi:hypothetical protein
VTSQAEARARLGDVRGINRVLARLRKNDQELGSQRPDVVNAAIAAIEAQRDAARRLRLARDRWAARAPVLRQYRAAMAPSLAILRGIERNAVWILETAGDQSKYDVFGDCYVFHAIRNRPAVRLGAESQLMRG